MIYVIQSHPDLHYKIGYTRDERSFSNRMRNLQTSTHTKLKKVLLTSGEYEHEARLHALLAKFRVRGEWFSDNDWMDPLLSHTINLLAGYGAEFVLSHTEDQLYNFCPIEGGPIWEPVFRCSISDPQGRCDLRLPVSF